MNPRTVVIVEDGLLLQTQYAQAISSTLPDAEIYPLVDSADLISKYTRVQPDLVITDLVMDSDNEGMNGITDLRKIDVTIPIIVASGHASFLDIAEAFNISCRLQKPVTDSVLLQAIRQALLQLRPTTAPMPKPPAKSALGQCLVSRETHHNSHTSTEAERIDQGPHPLTANKKAAQRPLCEMFHVEPARLDVQVRDIKRVGLNKVATRLNLITH